MVKRGSRKNFKAPQESQESFASEIEIPASQQTNYSFVDRMSSQMNLNAKQDLEKLSSLKRQELFAVCRRYNFKPGKGTNADIAARLTLKLQELLDHDSESVQLSQRSMPESPNAPPASQESLQFSPSKSTLASPTIMRRSMAPSPTPVKTRENSPNVSPKTSPKTLLPTGFLFANANDFKLPNLLSPSHAGNTISQPPVKHRNPVKLGVKQLKDKLKNQRLRREGLKG